MYEQAKERSEEAIRLEEEKAKALEAEQKAQKEKIRAEKAQKKADMFLADSIAAERSSFSTLVFFGIAFALARTF